MEVFAHLPGSNLGFFGGSVWQEAAAYVGTGRRHLDRINMDYPGM